MTRRKRRNFPSTTTENGAEATGDSMDRIMESSVERYNVGRLPYPVRDGILTVEIGPFCAMIFEEKVLDF